MTEKIFLWTEVTWLETCVDHQQGNVELADLDHQLPKGINKENALITLNY